MRSVWQGIAGLIAVVLLAACMRTIELAPPPTLYSQGREFPAEDVPPAFRSVVPSILFVTDRQPILEDGRLTGYGVERSDSMALGRAQVRFGDFGSWPALVERSGIEDMARQRLVTEAYQELVRLPPTPTPLVQRGGEAVPDPAAAEAYRREMDRMKSEIVAELRLASRPEVVVFVHGFNSELRDGITTAASLWHYAGRVGVPISYSWPAGNRGITAYLKDRESGEFSTFHFKEFIRALASIPELKKIHLIAHSRGADLVTSGLRELLIFERGAGRDPRQTLKVETLILAAPDLDFGVVQQRLVAEGSARAVGQVNVYVNPRDGALGFAQVLATGTRIGRLSPSEFTADDWQKFSVARNVSFIDVEAAGGELGHSYFRDNPAVLSDVVLTLRTGARAGEEARPLDRIRGNFWSLHANYPGPRIVREVTFGSDSDR